MVEYSFEHRLKMCEDFQEGTEIEDAVQNLILAARTLHGINYKHDAELALLTAENVCRQFVDWLTEGCADWSIYSDFPDEVFEYFSGQKKLSKTKFADQFGFTTLESGSKEE